MTWVAYRWVIGHAFLPWLESGNKSSYVETGGQTFISQIFGKIGKFEHRTIAVIKYTF